VPEVVETESTISTCSKLTIEFKTQKRMISAREIMCMGPEERRNVVLAGKPAVR